MYHEHSPWIQGYKESMLFVIVLVLIVLYVTIGNIFHGSNCTFSKGSLSLFHCRVTLYSSNFAKIFEPFSSFSSLFDPIFRVEIFLLSYLKMHDLFLWNALFSLLLHVQFCRTGLHEIRDTLHRYNPWPVYQHLPCPYTELFCSNLSNAFILLNLPAVRVSFVYGVTRGKNCLTFDTGRLQAFAQLRAHP